MLCTSSGHGLKIMVTSSGQPTRCGTPAMGLDDVLTLIVKRTACYEMLHRASDLDGLYRTA
jgi:hypothetical protein